MELGIGVFYKRRFQTVFRNERNERLILFVDFIYFKIMERRVTSVLFVWLILGSFHATSGDEHQHWGSEYWNERHEQDGYVYSDSKPRFLFNKRVAIKY